MQIICKNSVFLYNFIKFLFSIFDAGSFLEAFLTLKHEKINQVCLYCYVFRCFMTFLCILLFLFFMYFIVL